jgi:hypothetical protein
MKAVFAQLCALKCQKTGVPSILAGQRVWSEVKATGRVGGAAALETNKEIIETKHH